MTSVSAVKQNTPSSVQRGQTPSPTSANRAQGNDLASQERSLQPSAMPNTEMAVPAAAPAPAAESGDHILRDNQVMVMPTNSGATTSSLNAAFSTKLRGLGLAATGREIRETEYDGGKAWKFDWNPAWGPQTGAYLTNENFRCVEAAACLVKAQALPGYAALDSADKTRLDNILGSAENLLSSTARNQFNLKLATMKAGTAEQQAATLREIINSKALKPGLANEVVSTFKTEGTLSKVGEDPKYKFQGKYEQPAELYLASFTDGTKVDIISPKGGTKDPKAYYHTVEEVFENLKHVMPLARASVKRVVLNNEQNVGDAYWAEQFKDPNFRAYMTASQTGEVNVYATNSKQGKDSFYGSMQHEAGHTLSFQDFGYNTDSKGWKAWKAAADKDGVGVSNYGMNNLHEDYAETARVFQATFGTPRWDEYNRIIPNRFEILTNGVR